MKLRSLHILWFSAKLTNVMMIPESDEVTEEYMAGLLRAVSYTAVSGDHYYFADEFTPKFLQGAIHVFYCVLYAVKNIVELSQELGIDLEEFTASDHLPELDEPTVQVIDVLVQSFVARNVEQFRAIVFNGYLMGVHMMGQWIYPLMFLVGMLGEEVEYERDGEGDSEEEGS